ncbi:heparan-alpha-glucosaminide N-acetyltransferase domain-containing protein [Sphingomonas sp. NIBR02145]|uniref:DUF1624 domain-containing protein n=1 Tax=Sphingomonas sp. NIBR02145 TaxID=3014784 RepID=UPI0022B59DEF|nr:heparan-alpha-glucosaminide N-acetyltransferase domain-containing protein [Sphingomonas sp. NIBR02145]WHU03315.1 heparan-alpha-glucosaminide N-acetyltransferase domain-containing protein [Sphingomonas sp. NIBR02145]
MSIDALRGLVILLMLVDHTREFFFRYVPVSDPMDVEATTPALFFTRLSAHLCAPIFVLLTGVGAWLYAAPRGGARAASDFLWKRGLFLVVLELTVVSFAWSFELLPDRFFLQVIWVIGLSMLALAALAHLPRWALIAVGLVLVLGHNLLDGVHVAPGGIGHVLWAVLHERTLLPLPWGGDVRTSYPLLPWIGVIALGYGIGPWVARGVEQGWRLRALVVSGVLALLGFVVLRAVNVYGDPTPWQTGSDGLRTVMSFLNLTKYPPSADFLLLTLGVGALLLAALEKLPVRSMAMLAVFGSAPLFFYILHLYLLHAVNRIAALATGVDGLATLPNVASLWSLALVVAVPCWFACRWFGGVKRASGAWWMRYL